MSAQSSIKLLGISGSLRKQSYNSGALRAIPALLPDSISFSMADLSSLPFYNADVEQSGLPEAVKRFRADVARADALIFAVPEYNFSIPGVLKNAMEWLSRQPDPPAHGKPCAVFGASVSPLGTARGQFHFRHVCVSLNMMVVNAPHVDITSAKSKFDTNSTLTDQPALDSLRELLAELKTLTLHMRASRQDG
jgi:chromate reductase, NAD(P)H dehydrogenase (quinone)